MGYRRGHKHRLDRGYCRAIAAIGNPVVAAATECVTFWGVVELLLGLGLVGVSLVLNLLQVLLRLSEPV